MHFFITLISFLFKSAKNGAKGIASLITAGIDYITYAIFVKLFGFSVVISNIFSWIIAESFAFSSNKIFKYKGKGDKLVLKEYIKFFLARLFVLIIESVILKITIDLLGFEELKMKIFTMVIVWGISWLVNRFIVFSKSEYVSLKDWIKIIKNRLFNKKK